MLRSAVLLLLAVVASPAVLACQRLTGEQCESLCWRYNELHFWERFDRETADLAPSERDRLRAEKQKEWAAMRTRESDRGLENCVRECRTGASPKDLSCVERASTAEQARACMDD